MRKDDLLTFLINQTDFFDPHDISKIFTASHLAQRFGLQRNTASHYLNQLVAAGVVIKINTRPVYFLHKASYEQQFYRLSCNEFASVEALLAENNHPDEVQDHFSLRRVIESVTILDTGKVINQVEQFLSRYQHLAGISVANDRKVALYIHVSCLIERLIRQAAIQHYAGSRPQCQRKHLPELREAFSVIEASYSVNIPEAELLYIHDILHLETEFLQYDQEF